MNEESIHSGATVFTPALSVAPLNKANVRLRDGFIGRGNENWKSVLVNKKKYELNSYEHGSYRRAHFCRTMDARENIDVTLERSEGTKQRREIVGTIL